MKSKPSPELFLSRVDDLAQRLLPDIAATAKLSGEETIHYCFQLAAEYFAIYEELYQRMGDSETIVWRIYHGILGDSPAVCSDLRNGGDAADVEDRSDHL